ncbi:MAG: helix-turn-helix domain-containing protein [Rhodoferax sp.]|nr:helix-turn-helix domain-containing protein [Rhodoferax sp.]
MTQPAAKTAPPAKAATKAAAIPTFALYGEAAEGAQELLHIEEVRARSSLYQWEISPHTHRGLYQLLWVQSGALEVQLDATVQHVQGPVAIVVPPGVVHGFKFARDTEGLVLTLGNRFLVEGEFAATGERFCAVFESAAVLPMAEDKAGGARLAALLSNLLAEFHAPLSSDSPVVLWLARAILWLLTRMRPLPGDASGSRALRQRRIFTRFLLLVEQHVLEHWSLQQYAARLGLSTQGLNRLVRAVNGQSALEVVHARLTREACRRLVYTAAPVGNLAAELGFEDAAYFSRFFKKQTGKTPVVFRQERETA